MSDDKSKKSILDEVKLPANEQNNKDNSKKENTHPHGVSTIEESIDEFYESKTDKTIEAQIKSKDELFKKLKLAFDKQTKKLSTRQKATSSLVIIISLVLLLGLAIIVGILIVYNKN